MIRVPYSTTSINNLQYFIMQLSDLYQYQFIWNSMEILKYNIFSLTIKYLTFFVYPCKWTINAIKPKIPWSYLITCINSVKIRRHLWELERGKMNRQTEVINTSFEFWKLFTIKNTFYIIWLSIYISHLF